MDNVTNVTNGINGMNIPKFTMIHIASEILIIGGLSFMFHRKISDLNNKIINLEKKIEGLEKELEEDSVNRGGNGNGITLDQFSQFQQQTSQHINNMYSAIRQLANSIPQSTQPLQPTKPQQKPPVQHPLSQPSQSKPSVTNSNSGGHVSFSLTSTVIPPVHQSSTQIDVMEDDVGDHHVSGNEDVKQPNEDELDQELEDELKELDIKSFSEEDNKITNIDIKSEIEQTSDISLLEHSKEEVALHSSEVTPLEFVIPKAKKTVKKKKL